MPIYEPSSKHCPPYTASGTRCPAFSRTVAQELLDESEQMGQKRVATWNGLPFVAQRTYPHQDIWHGYPDSWDHIEPDIIETWKRQKKVRSRDLKRWEKREQVELAWQELK